MAKFIPQRFCNYTHASRTATMRELMNSSKSLIRWGDGETGILFFKSLTFQKFDLRLWCGLLSVLVEGMFTSRFLFAIPFAALQAGKEMDSLDLWKQWFPTRLLFALVGALFPFLRKRDFHESHLFRGHEGFGADWKIEDPTPLISDMRVAYVGNSEGFLRFRLASGHLEHLKFIEFPEAQGFANYKMTRSQCQLAVAEGYEVLVLACGPTAKLLARKLSRKIRVLDLGHWQDFVEVEGV